MDEKQTDSSTPLDFSQHFLTMMSQFFSGLPGAMTDQKAGEPSAGRGGRSQSAQDALLSIIKTWGTMSSAMSEPASADALASGLANLPEIMTRFFQTGMTGFMKIHEQAVDKLKTLGKHTEAYSFDSLDEDRIRAWSDFYEKEVRQYLKVPQLGLVRFYQERFNQAIDKFNVFNARFAGFMQILMLPMEKSFKVLHERIEEQIREGKAPEDPHEYYRLWVKILEGHYMTLFKSSEYTKALADTLSSYEEYLSSRNQTVTDALHSLPIPTNKDLDDLYEEIYHLKKRVKDVEKANRDLKKSVASGG